MRTNDKDNKFISLLENFKKSHRELAEFFLEDDGDDYTHITPSSYPFESSFDDYLHGIYNWVHENKESLNGLKTDLNRHIATQEDAVKFLKDLHDNNEDYHPDDDANDIRWGTCKPTKTECENLNILMDQIRENTTIDPCGVLLRLQNNAPPCLGEFDKDGNTI